MLESHFSLENVCKFLIENNLNNVRKIILCHLSSVNSNEIIMQQKVQELTGVNTEIATKNKVIALNLYEF